MNNKKRLFLVDGMSNVFRAYHAIRGLSNSRGVATNAVFGFTMTLRKLITQYQPDYIGMVLDSKERVFRKDAYEDYKANRPDMPDDLASQMPYILRVCEAFRVPVLMVPGFEADDIIGTLAHKAAKEGLQAVLVSSDKDLCQLVRDPEIVVLRFGKEGETWYDEAGVKTRLGVKPEQVPDLLGLMGDTSDNIPGAPGIGEKGAAQLIEQFGSIEGALENYEQVKKKTYRESLRDHAAQIRLSRGLATIDVNVPVELDVKSLELEPPDHKLAYELFSELEFGQLTREFADAAKLAAPRAGAATVGTVVYKRLSTVAELEKLAKAMLSRDRFAFAFAEAKVTKAEAGNLFGERQKLIGVAFSTARGQADYFDLENADDRDAALKVLRELFDNGFLEKAVHDLKRAMHAGAECGIVIENVVDDTLLQAYLLDAERTKYELPDLAREHLNVEAAPAPADASTADLAAHHTLVAADLTGQLADALNARITAEKLDHVYLDIELPLVPLLYEMERAGFRVDTEVLKELSVEMQREMEKLGLKIYELAGQEFNINSPGQLGEIFEKLNFEVSRRTTTGKISTSRDVLEELAAKYELPRLIIEYRELAKLKGTYVDAFPDLISPADGRIHTTLNQTATATGRLSSVNPNLQNIPIRTEMGRRIRRAFIPADGCVILAADYSQIELRLLAHITGDPVMLEAFRKGEDIHARTAREVFGAKTAAEMKEKRRLSKIVNFAIAYVVGPFGLAQRTTLTRAEAKKAIEDYYKTYAGVHRFMEETPDRIREANGEVRSIFGRKRVIPDIGNKNHNLRARAEREAINMPMQGTAADIVKIAMLKVAQAIKREKLEARMILQVHDELVFEVPKKEAERAGEVVKEAMEQAVKLDVPLDVEVGAGANWMEAKP